MIKKEYREEIYLVALVLLGLYLSLIENIIPKPFPWMKIGLSNISVLIALEKFNSKMALQTILLRVFIQALMLGTLFTPNFIISFSAGLISTLFMIFLYKFRKYLSLLSISCISAFTHNLLQLIVVYFLLFRNISLKDEYDFNEFFSKFADELSKEDGKTIDNILNETIHILYKDTYLKENEIEEFKKLILSLGKSEVESQERLIDLTVENLKKLTVESKEDIKNKGNLYKKLITFSGICIGIILI